MTCSSDSTKQISVIGGGYVGLVTAACLADLGHMVTLIDIDEEKIRAINAARSPVAESGLNELLAKNLGKNLIASSDYESVKRSYLSIICVNTPATQTGSADLSSIEAACLSLGHALRCNSGDHVVVTKSTVPPGTTESLIQPLVLRTSGRSDKNTIFLSNPEFLREGSAISDFMSPDRIIAGSNNDASSEIISWLYAGISAPVMFTSVKTAEMSKYVTNAFLATKISFSNEIGNVCKRLGIDVYEVMQCVGMDHRISPHFFNAGVGFGGACFPKDIRALISLAEESGETSRLLQAVMDINRTQPYRIVHQLENEFGDLAGKRIALLGLAFKAATDDIRESRAIPIIQALLEKGAVLVGYDPLAMENMKKLFPEIDYVKSSSDALQGADACIVLTESPEFAALNGEFDQMNTRMIIEGRRILQTKEKQGICW